MGIIDAAKVAANMLKEAGKIEEYTKILELIDDAREQRGINRDLEEENRSLKEKLKISGDYIFNKNAYWNKDSKDGPFCSRCFDKHKDLIRIIKPIKSSPYAVCPDCKSDVEIGDAEKQMEQAQQKYIRSLDPYNNPY